MLSPLKDYKNRLIKTVEATIKAHNMIGTGDSVLVGVSGGPDSVALLHIILSLTQRFSLRVGVAHLNHCLRQKDSDDDAEFVASLARKLDLPCYLWKKRQELFATDFLKVSQRNTCSTRLLSVIMLMIMQSL